MHAYSWRKNFIGFMVSLSVRTKRVSIFKFNSQSRLTYSIKTSSTSSVCCFRPFVFVATALVLRFFVTARTGRLRAAPCDGSSSDDISNWFNSVLENISPFSVCMRSWPSGTSLGALAEGFGLGLFNAMPSIVWICLFGRAKNLFFECKYYVSKHWIKNLLKAKWLCCGDNTSKWLK